MKLVVDFHLKLHQMDVKIAFLNGIIDETFHIVQPENLFWKIQSIWFVNLRNLSMGSSKHLDNGISNFI